MKKREDRPAEALRGEARELRRKAKIARSRGQAFRYLERAADEIEECLEGHEHSGVQRTPKK